MSGPVIPNSKIREAKDCRVEGDDDATQPPPADDAKHGSGQQHDRDHARVMPAQLAVGVAHCLQRGDLGPLQGDEPAQNHVDEEGGDAQKDHRHHPGQRLQLAQLSLEDLVRELVLAPDCAVAAVGREQPVDGVAHVGLRSAGLQPQGDVVECALELEGGRERGAVHPEDGVPFRIVSDQSWPQRVDELRRERHADHAQLP